MLRVTAYGQHRPYLEQPGFGALAEAPVGLAWVSGFEDRPPLLPAYPLAEVMAASLGATAVLAALQRRHTTATGDTINLAIYEAALKLVEVNIMEYQQLGTEHGRTGNRYGPSSRRQARLTTAPPSRRAVLKVRGASYGFGAQTVRCAAGPVAVAEGQVITRARASTGTAGLRAAFLAQVGRAQGRPRLGRAVRAGSCSPPCPCHHSLTADWVFHRLNLN